jgi:cytochrome c oxidase assembly protein subunit 20
LFQLTTVTARIFTACSWAVAAFCFAGTASYEYCHLKRNIEKANMRRAVEIIDFKKAEKEAKLKAVAEERKKAKEEAERKVEEAKRSSWKFW